MNQISLFKDDQDHELFENIRRSVTDLRSFRYLESFLVSLGIIGMTYFVSFFLLGSFCEMSKETQSCDIVSSIIKAIGPKPWGAPVSIGYVAFLAFLFLVAVLRSALAFERAQRLDKEKLEFLRRIYSDKTLENWHTKMILRARSFSEIKILASGLEETEIEAIRKMVIGSKELANIQLQENEAERVFNSVVQILNAEPLKRPVST